MTQVCCLIASWAVMLALGGGAQTAEHRASAGCCKHANCCTDDCCTSKEGHCCTGCTREQVKAGCCKACCEGNADCCAKCCNKKTAKERDIESRLKHVVSMDFTDVPLATIAQELSKSLGVNIVLDKAALVEAGISPDQPVTLQLEHLQAASALRLLLNQCQVTYTIQDGVVLITTNAKARGQLVRRVYPVDDLVTGTVESVTPATYRATHDKPRNVHDLLIHLITDVVAPDTWSQSGGAAAIDYYPLRKALVVNQTPDAQEQVADLLAALRRLKGSAKPEQSKAPPPVPMLMMPPGVGIVGGFGCCNPAAGPCMPPVPAPVCRLCAPEQMPECRPPLCGPMPACCAAPEPVGPPNAWSSPPCHGPACNAYVPPLPLCMAPAPVACGPGQPCPAPCMPTPVCTVSVPVPCPPPPAPVGLPCAIVPPAPRPAVDLLGCTIRAVKGAKGGRELEITGNSRTRLTCREITLHVPEGPALKLAVAGDQVTVRGTFLHATADRVSQSLDQITLLGHVQVQYHKDDQKADVQAHAVVVDMQDGHLQIIPVVSSGGRTVVPAKAQPAAKAAPNRRQPLESTAWLMLLGSGFFQP
jgi:hypothetical protein